MGDQLQVGDRASVLIFEVEGKTGTIVGVGRIPCLETRELDPDPRRRGPEDVMRWWKARLDGTGGEEDFPQDTLTKCEQWTVFCQPYRSSTAEQRLLTTPHQYRIIVTTCLR